MNEELIQAFTLGNAAILTNACLLPLYPGLIAFLGGNTQEDKSTLATISRGLLGVPVLAGILTMMVLIGALLFGAQVLFSDILPLLLPIIYLGVIAFGIMMLRGYNPFAKMQTMRSPIFKNRYVTAYLYGLFFAPMTLPCTGPLLISSFALGTAEGGSLGNELMFFLAFGVGFGWPLLVLPLFAAPLQRVFVGWLAKNHDVLTRASGILLIAVGLFGFLTELLPQVNQDVEINETMQLVYWFVAALITIGVGYWTYQRNNQGHATETMPEQAQA